jgi:hypothetical protein
MSIVDDHRALNRAWNTTKHIRATCSEGKRNFRITDIERRLGGCWLESTDGLVSTHSWHVKDIVVIEEPAA